MLAALLLVAPLPAHAAPHHESEEPAKLAALEGPSGVLRFKIVDEKSQRIPGRLTFVGAGGDKAALFPLTDARPGDLAVRLNVVYSLSGEGAITVPVGDYTVYATRGMEWSRFEQKLSIRAGSEQRLEARLAHELNTRGWVNADFHLHTKTYSGHGDANLNERLISLIGEGLELAVATDHNHQTDYAPIAEQLDASSLVKTVVGNEVSTPIGHFNAFPLDPTREPVDKNLRDANKLFRLLRAETNPDGVVPVIQLNHPRWVDIDYFGHAGFDALTGLPTRPSFSFDFDTIELLNANPGRGYHDSDLQPVVGDNDLHSVLLDWFHLLNRGHHVAAVGNSDSHTVHEDFAGWPRNFVRCPDEDIEQISIRQVADSLRRMDCSVSLGPFATLEATGDELARFRQTPGGFPLAPSYAIARAQVQAASWIDADRLRFYANGDLVEQVAIGPARAALRIDCSRPLHLLAPNLPDAQRFAEGDAVGDRRCEDFWLAVVVEGDDPLAPIVVDQERPVRPLAIANPLFVDGDWDGVWTPPIESVAKRVEAARDPLEVLQHYANSPALRSLALLACLEQRRASSVGMAAAGLADPDRGVLLSAARVAESLASPALLSALAKAWKSETVGDAFGRLALLNALKACGAPDVAERLLALVQRFGGPALARYEDELERVLPGAYVREWSAIGYFPAPRAAEPGASGYGPERDADLAHTHAGKGGARAWRDLEANEAGYLDLRGLSSEAVHAVNGISYAQTFLVSPDERELVFALGTDDGCRVWINGALVHEDHRPHGASIAQFLGRVQLARGANRVLFEVVNGQGATGLTMKLLDPQVVAKRRP